jgi:hypothetical protein
VGCSGTTLSVVGVNLTGTVLVVDSFVLPETRFGRATYEINILIIDFENSSVIPQMVHFLHQLQQLMEQLMEELLNVMLSL